MSNTLQNLVATSFKYGKSGLGVLTSEQAYSRCINQGRSLVTISSHDDDVFFFSDDHIFGYQVLSNNFVPCSGGFPNNVSPRENLPDGKVDTIEKYIDVFHKGQRQITTIEELAEFIDNKNIDWIDTPIPIDNNIGQQLYDKLEATKKEKKEMKKIKWMPEHFPTGTVVILGNYEKVGNEFHFSNNGGAEVTVTECVNNGPDNWLIRTDAWNESLEHFQSFNFDHVTGIKSRGNGPVKIHKHPNSIKGMPNLKGMISNDLLNKNRFYSFYSCQEIVSYLIRETGFINNLYIHEGFFEFFYNQTFVRKNGRGWGIMIDFDKKKAKRFVRQNINRWIKPMKEIRIEETIRRKRETEEYYRDMEDEWNRDFEARHPEMNEESTPVPADHFYGPVDMDIKDNFNTYYPTVIDNPFITEDAINKAIEAEFTVKLTRDY